MTCFWIQGHWFTHWLLCKPTKKPSLDFSHAMLNGKELNGGTLFQNGKRIHDCSSLPLAKHTSYILNGCDLSPSCPHHFFNSSTKISPLVKTSHFTFWLLPPPNPDWCVSALVKPVPLAAGACLPEKCLTGQRRGVPASIGSFLIIITTLSGIILCRSHALKQNAVSASSLICDTHLTATNRSSLYMFCLRMPRNNGFFYERLWDMTSSQQGTLRFLTMCQRCDSLRCYTGFSNLARRHRRQVQLCNPFQ